jgi:WD40 repeat protein
MADNNNIVSCVALASNDYIVNGYTNGYIKIFDAKTKELICNWNSYHSSVVAISGLDNDGTFIVSAGDNDIKIWNKNDPIYTLNPKYIEFMNEYNNVLPQPPVICVSNSYSRGEYHSFGFFPASFVSLYSTPRRARNRVLYHPLSSSHIINFS